MSQYNQNQPPESYPPPGTANPQKSRMEAPPPAGYPTRDGPQVDATSGKTQSRGDGFWKGCCAALCCCCMLDACF